MGVAPLSLSEQVGSNQKRGFDIKTSLNTHFLVFL